MHLKDEAPPSAVETLAMEICELHEDINELRDRLDGRKPQDMVLCETRAERWQRILGIVEGAVAKLAEQRRKAEGAGLLQ